MRKLVYGINLSADGCCDHSKFGGSADVHDYFRELLEDVDLLIYGRKTYELMVPFWPELAQSQSMDPVTNAFARAFASVPRVLVTRNAKAAVDEHTSIIYENVRKEIFKLKQRPGKAISTGGVELPAQLIQWGLVDEFHLVIHPVIVGEGRRLFTEMRLPENMGLAFKSSERFANGCMALRYERA